MACHNQTNHGELKIISISPEFDANKKQLTLLFARTAEKVNMKAAVIFWITAAY